MDSTSPTSPPSGPAAANTAETLRALQERAQSALAAQRARMGQLESQLTDQLDAISAAISEQLSAHSSEQHLADQSNQQIEELRQTLAETQAAWAREREQAAADATNRSEQLERQRAELDSRAAELTSGRRDLETRQQALDDRATQLNARERELRKAQDEADTRSAECVQQQSLLTTNESRLQQDLADLVAKTSACQVAEQELATREWDLQSAEQALAAREFALQSSHDNIANDRADLERRELAWQTERTMLETERNRLREQLAQLNEANQLHGGELANQLAEAHRDLAAQQTTWKNEQTRAENERLALQRELDGAIKERNTISEELATLANQVQSTGTDLAGKLADAEQQLEMQRSIWEAERSQIEFEVRTLSGERDKLSEALSAATEQLEGSRGHAGVAAERDDLEQKFELAMEDMQRLRSRVAELEHELFTRPADIQSDSVELVRLRAERDSLAERVAALEQQPQPIADADSAQHITDLQRRFELAVEDVRDLKKQNAKLEAQLAATKSGPAAPAAPTTGNWESVKKQLLASLEGETGDVPPGRQKERSSIENTVRITDEVIATKDRQIEDLKAQLASGGGAPVVANDMTALIDADSVIQQHRDRIAQIEKEMEDKLRATEMALSMERAKIAREQAQLTELRIELEAMRGPNGTITDSGGNTPKRRWLSKLGLGEDEKK